MGLNEEDMVRWTYIIMLLGFTRETQTSWENIKSESLTGKVHHNYEEENNVFLKKNFWSLKLSNPLLCFYFCVIL